MRTSYGHVQSLSLLLAAMIAPAASRSGYPYDGPCGAAKAAHYTVWTDAIPEQTSALAAGKELQVTVTLPAHATPSKSDLQRLPPYPVIFFLNGFLVIQNSLIPAGFDRANDPC